MYVHKLIVEEMSDLIVEGYSTKDAFSQILIKHFIENKKLHLNISDLQQILARGASKGATRIEIMRNQGTLNRPVKIFNDDRFKIQEKSNSRSNFNPLTSNIYSIPLNFKEQVLIKYKDFAYRYKNKTKVISEVFKYFKVDITNPSDERHTIILNTIKGIKD